jgi:hypothetical protein
MAESVSQYSRFEEVGISTRNVTISKINGGDGHIVGP